jgi:hypothetical protein
VDEAEPEELAPAKLREGMWRAGALVQGVAYMVAVGWMRERRERLCSAGCSTDVDGGGGGGLVRGDEIQSW